MFCCFIISLILLIWVLAVYCRERIVDWYQGARPQCLACGKKAGNDENFSENLTRIYRVPFAMLPDDTGTAMGVPSTVILPDTTHVYWDGVEKQSCDLCPDCSLCPGCPQCSP